MASEGGKNTPTDSPEDRDSVESKDNTTNDLKVEEDKLKKKFPHLNKKGAGSHILQKRLNKGVRYFDSGDYNMAKENAKKKVPYPVQEKMMLQESTGETIPTPENVPARKTSINTHPQHPIKMRGSLQS